MTVLHARDISIHLMKRPRKNRVIQRGYGFGPDIVIISYQTTKSPAPAARWKTGADMLMPLWNWLIASCLAQAQDGIMVRK